MSRCCYIFTVTLVTKMIEDKIRDENRIWGWGGVRNFRTQRIFFFLSFREHLEKSRHKTVEVQTVWDYSKL